MLIYLIGFMGCGKSILGEKTARKLGYAFADLDVLLEEKYGTDIRSVFEEEGEDSFRKKETLLLEETFALKDTLIACGGGTPCFFENMVRMKKNGLTVYLKLAPGSLFHRLAPGKEKRPLIANLPDLQLMEFIIRELEKRETYYLQAEIVLKAEDLKSEDLALAIRKHAGL